MMPAKPEAAALRLVRTLAVAHGDERASDRELLQRFAVQQDDDAFTALLRRHGELVLGVALRVLRQRQDAEDVFQATFLLLARQAGTLRWQDSITGWLHRVAYHLALKSRRAAQRRSQRERRVGARPPADPWADLTLRDLQSILDEELDRLGTRYREPLILCCLQGSTRDEAARRLGLPLSTLSGRLEAGRALLRKRLARRGIPTGLALAGVTLFAPSLEAGVPATLVQATGQVAPRVLAGESLHRLVSAEVLSLVNGGLQAMFVAKLKLIAVGGILVLAAWFTAWSLLPGVAGQESPPQRSVPTAGGDSKAAPTQPQAVPGRTLVLARRDGPIALTPGGKETVELPPPGGTRANLDVRLSPDGTHVAYTATVDAGPKPPQQQGEAPEPWPFKIIVRKLGQAKPAAVMDMPAQQLHLTWSADGKRLVVTKLTGAPPNYAAETLLVDPASGKSQAIEFPTSAYVLDAARDGKTFLVVRRHEKKYELGLAVAGDRDLRLLTKLNSWTGDHVGRFSPDGARVLYTDADPADKDANRWGSSSKPYLLNVATKERTNVADFPTNAQALGVAWAPDGKRIAYSWMQLHAELLKKNSLNVNEVRIPTEAFLIVADADGRNARTVYSAKGEFAINIIVGAVDWR